MADKQFNEYDDISKTNIAANMHDNADGSFSMETWPRIGANTRVTAGGAAPGQSIKAFSSSGGVPINAGATINVYTVTSGKTLFLTDISVSTDSAASFLFQIKAGAVVIKEGFVSATAPFAFAGIESQPSIGSGVTISIVFPTVVGKNAAFFLSAFEQ